MIAEDKYLEYRRLMPIVCVNAVIFDGDRVLLVERATPPLVGEFWVPGGRVLKDEGIEEALMRKVRGETGLCCEVVGLVSVTSSVFSSGLHTVDLNFVLHRLSGEVMLDWSSSSHVWRKVPDELSDLRPTLRQLIVRAKHSSSTIPCWSSKVKD